MRYRATRSAAVAAIVGGLAFLCCGSATAENPTTVLTEYFDLLVSGNIESARHLWHEPSLERSCRFGIEYTDIPLKTDCVSPIVRDIPLMRNHLVPPIKNVTQLPVGPFSRLNYSHIINGKLVEHDYYMYDDGKYFWLCYGQDYYCRGWPVRESRYLRIHADPAVAAYLHPLVLDEADRFIERIADSLGLSGSELDTLAQKKIEYFYCRSDSTVLQITGRLSKGVFDPASNDVISSFFPHFHELVRLLVNYKLRRLPLYTQPLLLEGLAVYYGGRWGKTPSALTDLGCFLYREDIVELDSLLTVTAFKTNSGADISYPLAGLFTGFLIDRLGRDNLLKLYMDLSGSSEDVIAMTEDTVREALVASTGFDDWTTLVTGFEAHIEKVLAEQAVVLPGSVAKGEVLLDNGSFRIIGDDRWIAFEFSTDGGDGVKGNLLFGPDERLAEKRCAMYEEQYRGEVPFGGFRFGVRFDKNEAGLYDYATNQLVAKYIWGITPSEDYYRPDLGRLAIRFRRDLLGGVLPEAGACKLLPH
ncbi:MAG: hypothetical protein KAU35_09580 [candidate division Zixibacteria bacterium]|nr:hypothetical protein [candidate division Zixibacteria bacterium]